ncbi:MAG: hypothetical protein SGJ27_03335 [Candidatus Melainabacteria bacterium]|nr:hypothetical protein [Candidatus Melainabacteria bacterium]
MRRNNHFTRTPERKANHRAASGSVLIEGVSGLSILVAVIVPMIIFMANLAAQLMLQEKVAHVANQAAGTVDQKRYWLGAPRPGYDQEKASENAKAVAQELCKRIGIQNASVSITFDNSNPDFDITVCDINANAVTEIPFRTEVFGYDMARLFPGNVSARGVASHAKVAPYALIHMDAPHGMDESTRRPLGFNQRDVAVIPAYGFFYTAVAGVTKTPTPYGKGIANLAPENFFAMNHYHLKKSDVEHVVATDEDIQLSGWHKQHVISGKEIFW